MKKFWKIAGWGLLVLGVLALSVWVWWEVKGKKWWDKVTLKNFNWSADLSGWNLQDIENIISSGESKQIPATIQVDVDNQNNFSLPFCYAKTRLYYKGNLLSSTSDTLAQKCFLIPGKRKSNTPYPLSLPLILTVDRAGTGQLLVDKALGQNPEIDAEIDLSILGIPLRNPIKASFQWK